MVSEYSKEELKEKLTDHQVKTKFIGEDAGTRGLKLFLDSKAAGCQDNGK